MNDRSSRAEVRNPLLSLPSFRALASLGPDERAALHGLLVELRADARLRAAECWRRRKPPMAAYWAAVGVYAGHAARASRAPEPLKERGKGKAIGRGSPSNVQPGRRPSHQPRGDRP